MLGSACMLSRLIHGGQLFNGLAAPVCMAAPPLISATWFPATQRTTATSLGLLSGNVGFALSFIIGIIGALSLYMKLYVVVIPCDVPDSPKHLA